MLEVELVREELELELEDWLELVEPLELLELLLELDDGVLELELELEDFVLEGVTEVEVDDELAVELDMIDEEVEDEPPDFADEEVDDEELPLDPLLDGELDGDEDEELI